jgi:hypothetical protein
MLEKYAKYGALSRKTEQIGTKIEKRYHDDFVKECEKLGLKKGEALRYLVIEFLQSVSRKQKGNENIEKDSRNVSIETNLISIDTEINQNDSQLISNDKKSKPKKNTFIQEVRAEEKNKGNQMGGKNLGKSRSVKPWTVENQLPCPICDNWSSKSNFKRAHAAVHGYKDSYELLFQHLEKADQMMQKRVVEVTDRMRQEKLEEQKKQV